MKRPLTPMQEVNLIAKVADLREAQYENMLIIHALVELLTEKGVLTREELTGKARQLHTQLHDEVKQRLLRSDGTDDSDKVIRNSQHPARHQPLMG